MSITQPGPGRKPCHLQQTGLDLEDRMLRERSQTKTDAPGQEHDYLKFKESHTQRNRVLWWLPGSGRRGKGGGKVIRGLGSGRQSAASGPELTILHYVLASC